jgi:hypothetical protein
VHTCFWGERKRRRCAGKLSIAFFWVDQILPHWVSTKYKIEYDHGHWQQRGIFVQPTVCASQNSEYVLVIGKASILMSFIITHQLTTLVLSASIVFINCECTWTCGQRETHLIIQREELGLATTRIASETRIARSHSDKRTRGVFANRVPHHNVREHVPT